MQNEWLRMNQKKIDRLQYMLTELAYKNEYQSLPIGELRGMLGAAVVEIKKLTDAVEYLNEQLKKKDEVIEDKS